MLKRPGILARLFAIAATTGLSLMAAPASYASAPLGLYPVEPTHPVCVQANPAHGGAGIQLDEEWHQPGNPARIQHYGNGLCVRATGSKDNSAVWA
jgi:hypothetical protein